MNLWLVWIRIVYKHFFFFFLARSSKVRNSAWAQVLRQVWKKGCSQKQPSRSSSCSSLILVSKGKSKQVFDSIEVMNLWLEIPGFSESHPSVTQFGLNSATRWKPIVFSCVFQMRQKLAKFCDFIQSSARCPDASGRVRKAASVKCVYLSNVDKHKQVYGFSVPLVVWKSKHCCVRDGALWEM